MTKKQQPYRPAFSSFSVIAVFILLCIIGIGLIPRLYISLTPSKSLPSISVSYSWPRASAEIIEKEVTAPLEGLFSTIQGLQSISSHTSRSSGTVEMSFNEATDMDIARFEVAALIRQAYPDFPDQVSYPFVRLNMPNDDSQSLLTYTIFGNSPAKVIQDYAESYIKPPIANTKGVYQVSVYGSTPFAWYIRYESSKLEALDISENTIKTAISNHFTNRELGYAQMETREGMREIAVRVRSDQQEIDPTEIPIAMRNGRILYLDDIASVEYREQEPDSYYRVNGLNTINLIISAEKQVNSLKLAKEIKGQVESIREKLPGSYSMVKMYDATDYIIKELEKVAIRTFIALVVLLLFVWGISRRIRYVGIISLSLLVNLCIAVIFYVMLGVEVHIYSLAGMTISLGIIIDNSIIMSDHIRHRGNRRAFLSILAATLTTIGALSLIFFLDKDQQLNLYDFSLIIIINLGISLFVALFFIPALLDKVPVPLRRNKRTARRLRRISRLSHNYQQCIRFQLRWKWAFILLLIFLFGTPIHKLPPAFEETENRWEEFYNKSFGSEKYQHSIKPVVDKLLGGTLRLFTEFVYEGAYYSTPERTRLYITGKMPEGSTIHQLNEAVKQMESYLAGFPEVQLYTTSIHSYRSARITIYFTEESEHSFFAFYLKNLLIGKANSLGGMDWGVFGVGRGFSNATGADYRNSRIMVHGYNYEKLYGYAEKLVGMLEGNPRVKKLQIRGQSGWMAPPLRNQLQVKLNEGMLAQLRFSTGEVFGALRRKSLRAETMGDFFIREEMSRVYLESDRGQFDRWHLQNEFLPAGERKIKLKGIGEIVKKPMGNDINKQDQQYQLAVEYDFVGPSELSRRVREEKIEEINRQLPLGYKASPEYYSWGVEDDNKTGLLALVIVIIFFICAILFESLKQPFVILSLVPLSFIGAFLTFYLFDINFDQGGYASFILLAGITVNAGLYIINEYNNLLRRRQAGLKTYIKAFHHKIVPIFLTITSTILGLVPFLLGGQSEPFWFSFAAGSIGGLVFSFLGLVVFLPVYFLKKHQKPAPQHTH